MKYSFLIFILLSISLNAQDPPPLVDSGEVIAKGVAKHDEQDYEAAIAFYDMVHENDTNYVVALYEKAYSLSALEKYEEALPILEKGLAAESSLYWEFANSLNAVYDELDRTDDAIAILDETIEKYPYNYRLHYNRGASKEINGDILGALEDYQEVVRLNPFHSITHYRLAVICLNEGLLTQALLSYNAFLLLEPATQRSLEVLVEFDTFSSGKIDLEPTGVDVSSFKETSFESLDLIIKSEVALNKKFEIPTKIDYSCIRQNFAVFQKLKYNKSSDNWWMQTYVPFFNKIMDKDYFADFTHFIFLSSSNPAVSKVVKKNDKEIKAFYNWAYPEWRTMRENSEIMFNGELQKIKHHYDDNGRLQALGEVSSNGASEGYWEFFFQNGIKGAQGQFDDDKRVGEWKYYHRNGTLKESVSFENDERVGEMKMYFENGQIREQGMTKADKAEGKFVYFNKYGNSSGNEVFEDGTQSGPAAYYFLDGSKKYELSFKEGELDGLFKEFYPQGMVYAEKTFKMGKINGVQKTYYKDGELSTVTNFVDGDENGDWTEYFNNGQISAEGSMKEGKLSGKRTTYYRNGTVESTAQFDEDGKQMGVYKEYDEDGILNYEFDYKNGEIRAYRYYDKSGKIIKEATKKSGALAFEGYYPDGTKSLKGSYSLGSNAREGDWIYYNKYGSVITRSKHSDGAQNGTAKKYHYNGTLSSEVDYKNDKQNGYYKSYHLDGGKSYEGWVVDNSQEGEWIGYFGDGKTIEKKLWFLEDELDGRQYYYAPNGKLDAVSIYDEGEFIGKEKYDTTGNLIQTIDITGESKAYTFMGATGKKMGLVNISGLEYDGKYTWYFADGGVNIESNYAKGTVHGHWTEFYPNGKVSKEGDYVYGDRDGDWKEYYWDGTLKLDANYENGEPEGEWKWYHFNGTLETIKQFNYGTVTGEAVYYDPNGVLRLIKYYDGKNGKLIGYASPEEDGKTAGERTDINENNEESLIQSFYPNGNPAYDYKIEQGRISGIYLKYYENGQLQERISYSNGVEEGLREEYYENGQLRYQVNYKSGDRHGLYTSYYENGQIAQEVTFFYGDNHGPAKFYDESGNLINTYYWYADEVID